MKTKTRNKYSENFLNNQNYILGKTEKKKLLSKFFVERVLDYFLFLFSFVNSLFHNERYFIRTRYLKYNELFMFILSCFLFVVSFRLTDTWPNVTLGLIFVISFFMGYFLIQVIRKYSYKKYVNYRDFFYLKKFSLFNVTLLFILFRFFLPKFNIASSEIAFFLIPVVIILFFTLFILSSFRWFLNIFNLLFFPFILFIVSIFGVISYFFTYSAKLILIVKNNPITNLLEKFNVLENNRAENRYYKIELK